MFLYAIESLMKSSVDELKWETKLVKLEISGKQWTMERERRRENERKTKAL